ncbi:MAG: hypothetical protein NTV62_00075 [Candidatus Gribaldobacteria bacterium]|nr:hypothetical protein [Candidatus Gribaldobacteria bacterium]
MGILNIIFEALIPPQKDKSKEVKPGKETPQDFWEHSNYKTIDNLKNRAERMSSKVEGIYNPIDVEHRKEMMLEIFGEKGGIYKSNYKKKLDELEKKRQKAKSYHERSKVEELIKFYKAFDKSA